jgi:uncharacterized membrane protein YgcG
MKFQQIRTQVLFFLMFLTFGFAVTIWHVTAQQDATPATSAPLANATVLEFKDKVQVKLPGQSFSAPSVAEVLRAGTEIQTDQGTLVLRLEDESQVAVQPHTHLVLTEPATSNWQRLQVVLGHIQAIIKKRVSGAPPFQIGTPSAVISVRGTKFDVDVDKHNVTQVDVEEGVVELASAKGIGAPVTIQAGSSSRVGENSAPEPAQPTSQMQKQSGKSGNSNAGGNGNGGGNGGGHGNGGGNGGGHGNSGQHGNGAGNPHSLPPTSHGGGHK